MNENDLFTLKELDYNLNEYYINVTNIPFDINDYIDIFEIYKKEYPGYNKEKKRKNIRTIRKYTDYNKRYFQLFRRNQNRFTKSVGIH